MKKNVSLENIFNDKFLFFLPMLFALAFFSYYFNESYELYIRGSFEVLFLEVLIWTGIYSIIVLIEHFILKKFMNSFSLFLIKIATLLVFFKSFSVFRYVIVILCLVAAFLKEDIRKLCTYFISYMILCFCLINIIPAVFRVTMFSFNTKSSDISKDIVVERKENGPNIYWIHCDGMVSLSTAEKYFGVDVSYLRNYFKDNDYYTNEDATVVAAHHTMQSLVALYNPYYYDNFFERHLTSLEETYYNKKYKADYYVDYYDLSNRRLNNELFDGLDKAGYKIATVTEFNQYTSFYADYIYDYSNVNSSIFPKHEIELKFYDSSNNSIDMINKAVFLEHFKTLGRYNLLGNYIMDTNLLNYSVLDYNNFNYDNYQYIKNTDFWKSRAIIKSLDHLNNNSEDKRFVFVDFAINHAPWFFDAQGKVSKNNWGNKEDLANTYIHSMYLLTDMISYINDTDPNAVIILQADHGLHYVPGSSVDEIYNFFDAKESDVRLLRNSTINAVYIPQEYRNDDDIVLEDPLNISRYLINNYVGKNYEYRRKS